MKKLTLALMVLGLLALGGQAYADLCTVDAVPAATLLLPYFEVDIANDNGATTLFSINNASAAPALAHVTMWTQWSLPTIDFDVYLTGYDVYTVNLRDVFDGNIPMSAPDLQDPADTVSPHGLNPAWDGDFADCEGLPYNNPVIQDAALTRLYTHTGSPMDSGLCLGPGDGNLATGYITIDNANECSFAFPPDDGITAPDDYFVSGGFGIANNINQLWGDWFYVNPEEAFAQGDNLVHVEANDGFTSVNIPLVDPGTGATVANVANATGATFYGRYDAFLTGEDNREPLGTTWASRYFTDATSFTGGTDLTVWRDSNYDPGTAINTGYTCGSEPTGFQLEEEEVVMFSEEEDAVEVCYREPTCDVSPCPDPIPQVCFPYETGRYGVGEGNLETPYAAGWVYLNLNHTQTANGGTYPPFAPYIAQSYVATNHDALGLFSVGLQAIELTSACDAANPSIVGANNIPTL